MSSGVAYRERANECMRIAESCVDPCTRAVWMRCAAEWLALAVQIEFDEHGFEHRLMTG